MTIFSNVICKNCGNSFSGSYCNICGQKHNNQRLTFKKLIQDFIHAFTHFDKGYLFTIREMAVRPGSTIREYIRGKRSGHSNPLVMLLIIGGICSLLYMKLNLKMVNSINVNELPEQLHVIASKSFALTMIVYCFAFAAIDRIFFDYKHYNYTELFVMNSFIAIETLVLEICLVPVWLLGRLIGANDFLRLFFAILIFIYHLVVRYQFFEGALDSKIKMKLLWEGLIFLCMWLIVLHKTIYSLLF
jgi:hypothetical protein